jgi:hypothetical protein
VVRVASRGPLGDTVEKAHPIVVRAVCGRPCRSRPHCLGIAFAVAAAGPLKQPSGAPIRQLASIIVTFAVPTPITNVTQASNLAAPAEPDPGAGPGSRQDEVPPTGARFATRARMPPVSPKPLQVGSCGGWSLTSVLPRYSLTGATPGPHSESLTTRRSSHDPSGFGGASPGSPARW